MERTAIVLAGGHENFKCSKGLIQLAGKLMIMHVIDRVKSIVDELIICLSDDSKIHLYSKILPRDCRVIVDEKGFPECPLRGAYTGLLNTKNNYTVILPCDTPFISTSVINLLFDMAVGVNAVVPRRPEGDIEPLQAVYRTESALKAAKKALEGGDYSMRAMIALLRNVRYVSTLVIEEIDPKMYTFVNINTPLDLKRAEMLIRRGLLV